MKYETPNENLDRPNNKYGRASFDTTERHRFCSFPQRQLNSYIRLNSEQLLRIHEN